MPASHHHGSHLHVGSHNKTTVCQSSTCSDNNHCCPTSSEICCDLESRRNNATSESGIISPPSCGALDDSVSDSTEDFSGAIANDARPTTVFSGTQPEVCHGLCALCLARTLSATSLKVSSGNVVELSPAIRSLSAPHHLALASIRGALPSRGPPTIL